MPSLAALFLVSRGWQFGNRTVQTVGFSATALTFAALFLQIQCTGEDSRWMRWLEHHLGSPWLRAVGKVSYGMYVFHWPIAAALWPISTALQTGRSDVAKALIVGGIGTVGAAGTYVLAVASFTILEGPILRLKDRLAPLREPPRAQPNSALEANTSLVLPNENGAHDIAN
jgi:peptidoglycan/LPS O-acetylase OafA/YrhL